MFSVTLRHAGFHLGPLLKREPERLAGVLRVGSRSVFLKSQTYGSWRLAISSLFRRISTERIEGGHLRVRLPANAHEEPALLPVCLERLTEGVASTAESRRSETERLTRMRAG